MDFFFEGVLPWLRFWLAIAFLAATLMWGWACTHCAIVAGAALGKWAVGQ